MKKCDKLNQISKFIKQGCTNGYYPYWKIIFNDVKKGEINKYEKSRIAFAIQNGYLEGEIIIDCHNSDKNGWWKLQFE